MNKRIVPLLFTLLMLCMCGALLPASAAAQGPCTNMTSTTVSVHQLSAVEFDMQHFQSTTLLFTLSITNGCGAVVHGRLNGYLDVMLADGSQFEPAAQFSTNFFAIPTTGMVITNLDLSRTIRTAVDYNNAAKTRLQDVAASSGKLPAGDYDFHVELLDSNLTIIGGPVEMKFHLDNSNYVDLRSPRDGENTNNFPLFEFYQDGNRATLTVAELTPGRSRADAIVQQPSMLTVDLNGQNTYVYSGGRPLENGKSYVWQVVGKTAGAGGDIETPSPIYLFTVSNSGAGTVGDPILLQLEDIFGKKYPDLFKSIHDGQMGLTGENETLNGTTINRSDLIKLIDQLRDLVDSAELSIE